jgi:carboxymethylenebutenolidase
MLSNPRGIGLSRSALRRAGGAPTSLAALALCVFAVHAEPTAPVAEKIKESGTTFDSGGKSIHVDHFEPAAASKCPALVLLHGTDGPEPEKELLHAAARRFAARGYRVLLVHYFDRTSGGKDARDLFKKCLHGTATKEQAAACRARFREWRATVCDAVAYARTRPGVDGRRVGLVGFSLGAYLALSVAADESLRIAAVVEFFGGLPRETRETLKRLPPVLGFHGDADETVPVKEAEDLRELLSGKGFGGEVQIYKGVGHAFLKEGRLRWDAALDAGIRTAAFLEEHLRRGAGAERGK